MIRVAFGLSLAATACAADAPFRLTNDQPYRHALEVIWARQPVEPAYPERVHQWLSEVMTAADRMRWYRLAEAAAKEEVARWPMDAPAWVGLSCYVGKQGRFADAYADAAKAAAMRGVDADWPRALQATWAWHQGRPDEADALIAKIARPSGAIEEQRRWIACRVFHLATTAPGSSELPPLVRELTARPAAAHWLHFLRRDAAFDRLREVPWFVDAVGATAEGAPPAAAFPAAAEDSEEQRLIGLIPHSAAEADARQVLATVQPLVEGGRWQDALDAIAAHPQAKLPELTFAEALARAALDDADGAMDAIRALSHDGIRLASWTVDCLGSQALGYKVLARLRQQAADDENARRPVALALVIAAHIPLAFQSDDRVIKMMDEAEGWCSTLPEVPNTRAIAENDAGRLAAAEADYRKALILDPSFRDATANLASMMLDAGRLDEARALDDRRQGLGAIDPTAMMQRALILAASDRAPEAIAILEELAQAPPPTHRRLPTCCWECASRCSMLRRFAEAQQLTRMVLRLAPEMTDAWTKLSGDLVRVGHFDEALTAARTALDVGDPDAVDARLAVATCTYALGRHDEALERLAEIDEPGDSWHRRLFHGNRAIFAAITHDEDLLQRDIDTVLADTDDTKLSEARRRWWWLRSDILFDPYRDRPWFQALLKRAEERCQPKP